ncbi:MAG: L,D-transpeptidase family protein [Sphingobium sp.]
MADALRHYAKGPLKAFYASRDYKPLWLKGGKIGPSADRFLSYASHADLDGMKASAYDLDRVGAAMQEAQTGTPEALARADLALSDSFARFVRDQRRPVNVGMLYADKRLRPRKLKPEAILRAAALSGPFPTYVENMAWMSPHYVRLRNLLARSEKGGASEAALDRLRLNLDRARNLPGPWTMHVLVDASSARLWYYQGGKQLGVMKVVVGAQETQTPMMAGTLQWAILNPYWNIPDYLAEKSIAPKILSGRTLASMRIEALSDWSANPERLDPAMIDWQAVASGKQIVRLRELPGASNSMGKVKFLFPNDEGIYLHDTPNRDLLNKVDRHLSNGCIRLEDAPELGRWLLRKSIATASKTPEQYTPLPVQVPVYLTYLTATETAKGMAFRPDIYGRDK